MKLDPEILRTCMIACDNMAAQNEHRMRHAVDEPLRNEYRDERDIYQHAADTVREWLREMKGDAE